MAVQKVPYGTKNNQYNIISRKIRFVLKNQVKQNYKSLFYSKKDPSTDQDWISVDLSHSFLHFPRIFLYTALWFENIHN